MVILEDIIMNKAMLMVFISAILLSGCATQTAYYQPAYRTTYAYTAYPAYPATYYNPGYYNYGYGYNSGLGYGLGAGLLGFGLGYALGNYGGYNHGWYGNRWHGRWR